MNPHLRAASTLLLCMPVVFAPRAHAQTAQTPPAEAESPAERLTPLTGIAVRKGRRVVRELRLAEGDMPTVLAATRRVAPDRSEELIVVYEVSIFNQCVARAQPTTNADRRRAREACRDSRGVETKLARVHIAPTPGARTEDVGGAIEFLARQSVGQRSARPQRDEPETYFQAMGAIEGIPGSTLRAWLAITRCTVEEVNESRGEDIRSSWSATEERLLLIYDEQLEVSSETALGDSDASFERWADYAGPDVTAPTVRQHPQTHALTVRAGGRTVLLAYDAEDDTLHEP